MINLRLNRRDYNSIKICSDLHYGHDKNFVWSARGFESADAHSMWIREKVQSLVSNDLLFILGDVGLSVGPEPIIEFLNSIPCHVFMVWGNHNSGVKQLYTDALPEAYKDHEVYPLKIGSRGHITMLGDMVAVRVDSDRFFIQHMAPLIWPENDRGRVAFCGHSHGSLEGINPGRSDYGQVLDIGVDNSKAHCGEPWFELDEALRLVKAKAKVCLDHH
jgi:predicted phosphodiesterase